MQERTLNILIIDDDEDDVVLVADLLRSALGPKIKTLDHAASYGTALDFLDRNSYDVALVDYRLGKLSGIELLREVRDKGNVTPLIFLTGQGDQEVAVAAMKSGATDYLDKGKLSEDVLAQSIRYSMELHAKELDRKQAHEALQEMTRQRELILNSTAEGIFGLDAQGRITFINPAASRMLSYAAKKIIGEDAHKILHHSRPDGSPLPKDQCPYYATLANSIPQHVVDDVFWRKDGSSFPVEYMSTPIVESGKSVGVVINFQNITKRKQTEDELRKSHEDLQNTLEQLKKTQSVLLRNEKLASIGTLSAGVAHEILNPLNIIGTIVQLERLGDLPKSTLENLDKILDQVKRATKITNGLRMFAHQKRDELSLVDIHKLFDESASLIEHDLNLDNIVISRVYDKNLPEIYADEDKLAQVFLNLLNNARGAMKDREQNTITITTRTVKDCVEILFADNGPGIAPEIIAKIFDPFFTTKEPGEGTGLGLSLVHSIIENRGGSIHVESQLGEGTTFVIRIPIDPPASEKYAQEKQDLEKIP